ncbi:M23 family metallopeptidase [Streptomyces sp. NBC_00820]|uniref:M23 family metallopeptidase n=1 Tax=Streptomyces sp. NBC_00820 TaxID=2975842 RepID=UPI002ED534FC|nr:M23 family metallopeptidase [Streptomyces sp. NBC_00820]
MNDRHPSGTMTTPAPASDASSAHYAPYGTQEAHYDDLTTYGGYDTTGFATGAPGTYDTDPLYGGFPGGEQPTGAYDTTQWQTGTGHVQGYDPYAAQHHTAYDSAAYDTTGWTVPAQATGNDVSGQWDTGAWHQHGQAPVADPAQQWEWGTQTIDTGAYDATHWNSGGPATEHERLTEPFAEPVAPTPYEEDNSYAEYGEHGQHGQHGVDDGYGAAGGHDVDPVHDGHDVGDAHDVRDVHDDHAGHDVRDRHDAVAGGEDEWGATGELPVASELLDDQEEFVPEPRARSRRRTPAKRSALLTVAVPSVCVMGVAGIAAASVGNLTGDDKDTTASASDAHVVKPSVANSQLDAQLKTLSAGADDFADRASRTQERIDLRTQQALEKKKAAAEAALKERLRPKFALPVLQRGLSAYFGQAGVNWMSVHTGIDFPVSYGTTVMAATDGVVSTKLNVAYGNMLILTAKDGTQTWYCHLSRYRVPDGTAVKAGQPIAYSGDSGNSTGPHLHFEVRPAGGAAVDPLPWLRSHGLDPT